MMKVKYSTKWEAVRSRLRRLPRLLDKSLESGVRKRADRLVTLFHDGIKGKTLRLRKLRPLTVARKTALGYAAPGTPLYGMGDASARRAYMNMMEVHRRVQGSRVEFHVTPSKRRHHASKLRLSDLFTVHEYGTTIHNAFGRPGFTVRLPPRPALRYAYHKLMREMKAQDPAKAVRKAIGKYVQSADEKALQKIGARL